MRSLVDQGGLRAARRWIRSGRCRPSRVARGIIDSVIRVLRQLRHGPLRFLGPLWVKLGDIYRSAVSRPGRRTSTTTTIGGYGPFRVDGVFAFSDLEGWGTGHNAGFHACIEQARGTSCVFDVGAHVGLVTLPLSRAVGAQGRVVAFEPGQLNADLLERHLALNSIQNVEVVRALVGDSAADSVDFYERLDVPTGMNSMSVGGDGAHIRTAMRQVDLDAYCETRRLEPAVVKIDVEGAELRVLRGAINLLKRARPYVFLSVHPRQMCELGDELEDLESLVAEAGYEWRTPDGEEVRGPLGMAEYVLVPKEHAS